MDCSRGKASLIRCGSRIWSRGPQLPWPEDANIVKWSCASEVSHYQQGSRARLRALEAFGFLMLKYAFSYILETLILTASSTSKIIHYIVFFISSWTLVSLIVSLKEVCRENYFDIVLKNISIMWLVTHCFSLKCQSISSQYMLQEMRNITKSNWGLAIPMELRAKTSTFNLH